MPLNSIPDTDFCSECGMDWHQPRPAGHHFEGCPMAGPKAAPLGCAECGADWFSQDGWHHRGCSLGDAPHQSPHGPSWRMDPDDPREDWEDLPC